jgi:hypothetical protein
LSIFLNRSSITFTSSWSEGGSVPNSVQAWILMRVATLYKFREQVVAGVSVAELPREHGARLLDKWRMY